MVSRSYDIAPERGALQLRFYEHGTPLECLLLTAIEHDVEKTTFVFRRAWRESLTGTGGQIRCSKRDVT